MKALTTLFFAALMLLPLKELQAQDLPRPSQNASVMQRIGLTDMTVNYYRPLVRERKIWGGLVPYGKIWRTGANAATNVEFANDVIINGQEVPAGKYAFFTIPGENEWTVMLNSNWDQGGTSEYDKAEDVLTMKVKPENLKNHVEAMTFVFSNPQPSSVNLDLMWEKKKVTVPIQVASLEQGIASAEAAIAERERQIKNWRVYASSANFLLDAGKNLDKAREWARKSIEVEENWYNTWVMARIEKKAGNDKEALRLAKRAKELGEKDGDAFFYREEVDQALSTWK